MGNYFSVNLSKIMNSLIGFLTQYFLIRTFIPSEVGFVTYLSSISTIFFYFTDLGLTNYTKRILPSLASNLKDYYSYVGVVLIKKFIILTLFSIVFFSINFLLKLFNIFEFILVLITTLNLASNSRFIFESRSNFVFFSVFETSIKILNLFLIILFTYLNLTSYISFIIILNLVQLLSTLFIIFYVFSKVKIIEFRKLIDFSDFTHSLPYFIPSIYSLVYASLDRVLLISLTDVNALFIHSQAIFITTHLITFSTSLSSVNSPDSTKLFFEGNLNRFNELVNATIHNINIISFPIIIGFSILIIDFSPLFFNSFSNQIRITSSILIWDILLNGIFYLQMEQILLGMRKIHHYNQILILSTLLLLPIYLILIPLTGFYGASLSIVFGRIVGLFIANKVIKGLKVPKIYYLKFKYLLFSIIMGIAVLFVRIIIANLYLSIILQVSTGIIVYSLLIILYDKSSLKNLFLRKRFKN
jgi:O-antigen/teichoic acid export membrane protein